MYVELIQDDFVTDVLNSFVGKKAIFQMKHISWPRRGPVDPYFEYNFAKLEEEDWRVPKNEPG